MPASISLPSDCKCFLLKVSPKVNATSTSHNQSTAGNSRCRPIGAERAAPSAVPLTCSLTLSNGTLVASVHSPYA